MDLFNLFNSITKITPLFKKKLEKNLSFHLSLCFPGKLYVVQGSQLESLVVVKMGHVPKGRAEQQTSKLTLCCSGVCSAIIL